MTAARSGSLDPLAVISAAGSPPAEAVRQLRAALLFGAAGLRSVLVTGAGPGEAAARVAANLAASLAMDGRSVVLADAAPARPLLHPWFACPAAPGFADLCAAADRAAESLLHSTPVAGLRVLPAGTATGDLGTGRLGSVIAALQEAAGLVVLAGPPSASSAGAAALARHVEGTLLVIEAGVSQRHHVQRAKRALEQVQARLLGAVLVGGAPGG